MNALTTRQAEDLSTSAQERLAHLQRVQREIFAAMVSAGNARAMELLSPEDMAMFGYEVLSETCANAALLAMDDLTDIADREAQTASDFLHDLECELEDARHAGRVSAVAMAAE